MLAAPECILWSRFLLKFFILLSFWSVCVSAEGQTVRNSKTEKESPFIVVLDAGHGGRDSATRGGGVLEKDITLRISRNIKSYLAEKGWRVVLTRDSDIYVSLQERAAVKGDVFISLHCNSVADSIGPSVREMIKGIEIYSERSMTGGNNLLKQSNFLADAFKAELAKLNGIKLRAVRQKPLAVLRERSSPAILIELGYLSNEEDLIFLKSGDNDLQLAEAFLRALKRFRSISPLE